MWTLGGRDSDFALGEGAGFAFQHDVVPHGDGLITIFDNESGPPNRASQSRGHRAQRSTTASRTGDARAPVPARPAGALGGARAACRRSTSGGAFIGWGDSAYFTEYDRHGAVVLDARLATGRALLSRLPGGVDRRARPPAEAGRRAHAASALASTPAGTAPPCTGTGACSADCSATGCRRCAPSRCRALRPRSPCASAPAWLAVEALSHDGQPLARSEPRPRLGR